MALINTLRNKMGKVVVGFIAFAILSFVLADLLGPNRFFGQDTDIGKIRGETISLQEFQAVLQERENSFALSFNRQPTDRDRPTLRNQAWELLISRYAFEDEYDDVDVLVTSEEIWDMLQGKNIDPGIAQSFTNPETGEFDRATFMQYLQQLPSLPPETQLRWDMYKKELLTARQRTKYENLLVKSNYITEAEAERQYQMETVGAEVQYLYVPFYAVSDSLVQGTDDLYEDYYNRHKEEYKVDHTRDLRYVSFDIVPSEEDTALVREDILDLKAEFISVNDDSVFAKINTDGASFYNAFNKGNLPSTLAEDLDSLEVGKVFGPFQTGNNFSIYKVVQIKEDTLNHARANHILIKWTDESAGAKAEARTEARRILREIRNGADFGAMAREHGTDGTASRGGDLGWFKTGDMVGPFQEAVFRASRKGLLNDVVETQFGYHIIEVTETRDNTIYEVATIEREILPSDETRNIVYRKADFFASQSDDLESFEASAESDSVNVLLAPKIGTNDRRVGVLGDARQVVQWLFRDASIEEVSEVFEFDDKYVVAVMDGETEEGYQRLEDVEIQIATKVKNELKGEIIINKLNDLSGSLEEIASAYGEEANIYSSGDLKLNTNSLPSVGFDPEAVGRAFSLASGERTEAFASANGVLIIEMQQMTEAPEIADYAAYKDQLAQTRRGTDVSGIPEAIKDAAKIEDERYKFY